ncbi:MAG: hypothetical protein WC454_09310 [Phycisphaerae bacterium]|jgi:hypothetical protein
MDDNFSWLLMQHAELLALRTEVEGMIALNKLREMRGETIAYDEGHFQEKAEAMRNIANFIARNR